MKQKPWAYTKLKTHEQCPRQCAWRYGDTKRPFVETEAIKWGNQVDTALAVRITGGKLPESMQAYEFIGKTTDEARRLGASVIPKYKFGLTRELAACDYWHPQVWFRGEMDLALVGGNYAAIMDWKTGKEKDDPTQLALYAGVGFQYWPAVKIITTSFVWLKTGNRTKEQYWREGQDEIWQDILPRVKRMEEDLESKDDWREFDPKPSGLCPWCPVLECEFHPPGSKA